MGTFKSFLMYGATDLDRDTMLLYGLKGHLAYRPRERVLTHDIQVMNLQLQYLQRIPAPRLIDLKKDPKCLLEALTVEDTLPQDPENVIAHVLSQNLDRIDRGSREKRLLNERFYQDFGMRYNIQEMRVADKYIS
ncbi:hypothetical protein BGZ65_010319 [Modicella reniformis]|uniref:Uncharacterized protein n=1 Tax=Modicella reniformis TaxID=1440133 RepID=A0A9P6MKF0_9FUNG|nr:hypothetical protein BGZ65_010319 [Modicella reniformis]